MIFGKIVYNKLLKHVIKTKFQKNADVRKNFSPSICLVTASIIVFAYQNYLFTILSVSFFRTVWKKDGNNNFSFIDCNHL